MQRIQSESLEEGVFEATGAGRDRRAAKKSGANVAEIRRLQRVSRSGYYRWHHAEPSRREKDNAELIEQIKDVFEANKSRYGSPRITKELRQQGLRCGKNRIARLMQENELAARSKKAFRPRTTVPGSGAAPNLIKGMEPAGVNQIWVSGITYIAALEGWLYLAIILDLFSRKVVGWKLGETLEAALVVTALENALTMRTPNRGLFSIPIAAASTAVKPCANP